MAAERLQRTPAKEIAGMPNRRRSRITPHFLGTRIHSACWPSSEAKGIIVIEALFDYAARDEIPEA